MSTGSKFALVAISGVDLEGAHVHDGDGARLHDDESLILEAGEGSGDDVADGADAGGDLMIGEGEAKVDAFDGIGFGALGFGKQEEREPLPDFVEG